MPAKAEAQGWPPDSMQRSSLVGVTARETPPPALRSTCHSRHLPGMSREVPGPHCRKKYSTHSARCLRLALGELGCLLSQAPVAGQMEDSNETVPLHQKALRIKMQMPSNCPDLQNQNSFILSIESIFIEHLQVPGTILGARDTAMNKTNLPVFMELTY